MHCYTFNKFTRIAIAFAVMVVVAGCATPPKPADQWMELPENMIRDIRFGQTLESGSMAGFRFKAEPGSEVTITVRSAGPDTMLSLYHASRWFQQWGDTSNVIATDFPTPASLGMFDVNGLHSEIVTVLPPDEDGVYYIWQAAYGGNYSVTLSPGVAPAEDILQLVQPIVGNAGKYMSPFTEDDTVAPWVEKGMTASVGANVGQTVGRLAAHGKNSSSATVAMVGGLAGEAIGRQIAIEVSGGWEFIKENSDLSFDDITDLARHLHYLHARHPQYEDVLKAAYGIYPELEASMQRVRQGY